MRILTALIFWSASFGCSALTCSDDAASSSRRTFFQTGTQAALVTSIGLIPSRKASAVSTESLIEELQSSKEKIEPIQQLLENQEWDKVRQILKSPPVNKLWNLSDNQNVILQLAKESGNVELFEMKDELALSLQMCDQLTYDNAFVYFQPGSGKVNIKEPQILARKAVSQIQTVIDSSK